MKEKNSEKGIRREAFDPHKNEEEQRPDEERQVPPEEGKRLGESDLPGDPSTGGRLSGDPITKGRD